MAEKVEAALQEKGGKMKVPISFHCLFCGKEFFRQRNVGRTPKFCSKKCSKLAWTKNNEKKYRASTRLASKNYRLRHPEKRKEWLDKNRIKRNIWRKAWYQKNKDKPYFKYNSKENL